MSVLEVFEIIIQGNTGGYARAIRESGQLTDRFGRQIETSMARAATAAQRSSVAVEQAQARVAATRGAAAALEDTYARKAEAAAASSASKIAAINASIAQTRSLGGADVSAATAAAAAREEASLLALGKARTKAAESHAAQQQLAIKLAEESSAAETAAIARVIASEKALLTARLTGDRSRFANAKTALSETIDTTRTEADLRAVKAQEALAAAAGRTAAAETELTAVEARAIEVTRANTAARERLIAVTNAKVVSSQETAGRIAVAAQAAETERLVTLGERRVAQDARITAAEYQLAEATRVHAAAEAQLAEAEAVRSRGSLLGRAALVGVAGAFVYATAKGASFEEVMRNVNSLNQVVTATTAQSERAYRSQASAVLEISSRIPKAANDLGEGLYEIASSGFFAGAGLQVLNASAKAAVAGVTTVDVASKALVGSLNSYGETSDKAIKYSDILFQTVKLGVIRFEELGTALGYVTNVAARANIPLEDVGAAIATMTRAGVQGAKAGVLTQNVISALIQPSKQLKTLYKELGFESGAAALEQYKLQGVIEKIYKATGGQVGAISDLFRNQRSFRGVTALMAGDMKLYRDIVDQFGESSTIAGATQRTFNEQMKSSSNRIRLAVNQIRADLIQAGTSALPFTTAVAEYFGGLTHILTSHSGVVLTIAAAYGLHLAKGLISAKAATSGLFKILVDDLAKAKAFFALIQSDALLAGGGIKGLATVLGELASGFLGAAVAAAPFAIAAAGVILITNALQQASASAKAFQADLRGQFDTSTLSGLDQLAAGEKAALGEYRKLADAHSSGSNTFVGGFRSFLEILPGNSGNTTRNLEAQRDAAEKAGINLAKNRLLIAENLRKVTKEIAPNSVAIYDSGRDIGQVALFSESTLKKLRRLGVDTSPAGPNGLHFYGSGKDTGEFSKLGESVYATAQKLGIDLTKEGFDPASAAGRRLTEEVRGSLVNAFGVAGARAGDFSDEVKADLDATTAEIDKFAQKAADAFTSAFSVIGSFTLPDVGKATDELSKAKEELVQLKKDRAEEVSAQATPASSQTDADRRKIERLKLKLKRGEEDASDPTAVGGVQRTFVSDSRATYAQATAALRRDAAAAKARKLKDRQRTDDEAELARLEGLANELPKARRGDVTAENIFDKKVKALIALIKKLQTSADEAKDPAGALREALIKSATDSKEFIDLQTKVFADPRLDPDVMAKLITSGPKEALPILKAIVADAKGQLVDLLNTNEANLAKLAGRAAEQARLVAKATLDPNASQFRTQNLALAQRIQTANFNPDGTAGLLTAEDAVKRFGGTLASITKLAAEFGINFKLSKAAKAALDLGVGVPANPAAFVQAALGSVRNYSPPVKSYIAPLPAIRASAGAASTPSGTTTTTIKNTTNFTGPVTGNTVKEIEAKAREKKRLANTTGRAYPS